ncbi:hypothetical protein R3W88_032042 [Solanum pinnatisectum]|uniref:Uncharacterized protein n=1 Tax=Solanum pinnatisectum TaxID=50273 RepID=A0AAV9LQP2_9SOLN|nr:hypothetical protein R3W88_032042 [Solanum pinnatisectum]
MALTSHGSTVPQIRFLHCYPHHTKQSKLSPMRNVDQSQLRQSSPSPSLQITNIDVKTALAPVMEPLPSESTEETQKSLMKSTTKNLDYLYRHIIVKDKDHIISSISSYHLFSTSRHIIYIIISSIFHLVLIEEEIMCIDALIDT